MTTYSRNTQRAIKAYGFDACVEAFRMYTNGKDVVTVASQGPLTINTTQQADAAINAGREIAESGKRTALGNCQEQLQVALSHLRAVTNADSSWDEIAAKSAAREWLVRIGSEPN